LEGAKKILLPRMLLKKVTIISTRSINPYFLVIGFLDQLIKHDVVQMT
jgi:hypothetical protein